MSDQALSENINDDKDGLSSEVEEKIAMIDLKNNFQKLTPEKGLDEKGLSGYKEALDYAFSEDDINNIALTGVYGSGKSSILESYKKQSDSRFIHISLAHFDNSKTDIDDGSSNRFKNESVEEKTIEGKILNQLLHQINTKNIPQTIFRTKRNISKKSIISISLISIVFLISIVYILNVKPWISYLEKIFSYIFGGINFLSALSKDTIDRIAITVIIFFLLYLIYKIVITQLNRGIFKGFSFKSSGVESDIEIFNDDEASYFDKYLDDVLYLFVQSKANIIVFEDIDRFEEGVIFEKLKEINTLANNKLSSIMNQGKLYYKLPFSKKRTLKFIYLLKDDLFLSKDRTKFFDFIIPTVPVMTSTNSYEKLKELLEASGIYEKFDRNFLQKLSLYIDDMRLMKNIYNEYLVYARRIDLDRLNLNNNELLAILTYKNIFPQDFSELLYNRGFVHSIMSEKENYIKSEVLNLENEIEKLQNQLENADDEYLTSYNELFFLYLPYPIRIGNYSIASNYPSNADFIKEAKNTKETIYYLQSGNSWWPTTFEDMKEKVNGNADFQQRKKTLENKLNKDKLGKKIVSLKSKKESQKKYKLRDIVTTSMIKDLAKIEYKSISDNDYFGLIVFLIRNGYINEGYSDYITYFYENSLRLMDKNFLRSITDEKPLPWDHPLTKQEKVKEEILDRMINSDFRQIESLNFDLFEYLILKTPEPRIDRFIRAYFKMIKKNNKFQFILEAFSRYTKRVQSKLVNVISRFDDSLLKDIFSDKKASNDELNKFSIRLMSELSGNQLIPLKTTNKPHGRFFLNYIETSSDILYLISEMNEKLAENILNLKPNFRKVDFSKMIDKLSDLIFENGLYEVNFGNISSVLEHFFKVSSEQDIKHNVYTIISKLDDTTFLNHIERKSKVNIFVREYIDFSEGRIEDEPEVAYKLINNDFLTKSLKSKYISCLETNKLDLNQIYYESTYPIIIKNGKARPTETNIIRYFHYKDNEWTDDLIDFIERESIDYSFDNEKITSISVNDNDLQKFYNKTLTTNNLPNVYYRDILNKIDYYFPDFSHENILLDKIEILLELDIIGFSEISIQAFRDYYSEKLVHFLLNNIDAYIRYVSEEKNYNFDEMYDVLIHSMDLSIDKQKELVNCFAYSDPIPIREANFENEILVIILANHFNIEEIDFICGNYDDQSEKVKHEIYKIVTDNLEKIISWKTNLSKGLLKRIIADEKLLLEEQRLLLSRGLQVFDLKELPQFLIKLHLNKQATLFENKNPSFEKNEINKNVLNYLTQERVISSFKEIDGKYKAYNRRKKEEFDFLD